MWHISRLLVASLAAVATAATDGSIFIFDSETANAQTHTSVNEDAAKLLLQQRMLSTGFAASAALDEPVLELLNSYGGEQNSLFGEPHNSQQKLLVIIEGLTKDTGELVLSHFSRSTVAHKFVSRCHQAFDFLGLAANPPRLLGFYGRFHTRKHF